MSSCREATLADLDAVAEFLETTLGGGKTRRLYRHLLTYAWREEGQGIGFLIEDRGRILGFIGTVHSVRRVAGRHERFCNITCWAVEPAARGQESLILMQRVLAQPGITFTAISANETMQKALRFFGLQELDVGKVFLPAGANWTGLLASGRAHVLEDAREIAARLDAERRRLVEDHAAYGCACILIESAGEQALVVAVRRRPGRWSYAEVLHVSAPDVLLAHLPRLAAALWRKLRTPVVALEQRWVSQVPILSWRGGRRTFYRSKTVAPAEIDFLYTEMVPLYGTEAEGL